MDSKADRAEKTFANCVPVARHFLGLFWVELADMAELANVAHAIEKDDSTGACRRKTGAARQD
jgi:hypothetical protein